MVSLANDIKKNSKIKLTRQMVNAPTNQQQTTTSATVNDTQITPVDNVVTDAIE